MFYELNKPSTSFFTISDNLQPISLMWESKIEEAMPILRDNWIELQAEYQVYWTSCEIRQRKERIKKWANVYTNL